MMLEVPEPSAAIRLSSPGSAGSPYEACKSSVSRLVLVARLASSAKEEISELN